MTTTHKRRSGRPGRTIAAILLAAIAIVVGMVGAPAPAHAADQYIALAIGYVNENPPSRWPEVRESMPTNSRPHSGHWPIVRAMAAGAVSPRSSPWNECAAAASNHYGEMTGASDPVRFPPLQKQGQGQAAEPAGRQGHRVGLREWKHFAAAVNDLPPPPAPSSGRRSRSRRSSGGLAAHITDRSGVSSQCTYVTDDFSRSFALAANSTYDLRIAQPFRNSGTGPSRSLATTEQARRRRRTSECSCV